MINDNRTTFAKDLALNTGLAGSYLLGDVYDMEDLRDLGQGNPIYLVISTPTAATSGGAATVQFSLVSDAQEAIATDGSASVHMATGPIAVADLGAGETHAVFVLPFEGIVYERYLGILQTTGTAALTGGTVNAFLTQTPARWKALADGEK